MNAITYHFPDIPKARTLNSRGASKQAAYYQNRLTQEAKEYATALILEQRGGRPPAGLDCVVMTVLFTLPTRRKVDWQGLYGRIKPYEDALVDTGELTDDNVGVVRSLTMEWEYRKGESGVTITLTPIREG